MKYEVPVWEKVTLSVEEAAAYSGIGMCKIRELLNDAKCPFAFRVGKGKTTVKRKELEKFISMRTEI